MLVLYRGCYLEESMFYTYIILPTISLLLLLQFLFLLVHTNHRLFLGGEKTKKNTFLLKSNICS